MKLITLDFETYYSKEFSLSKITTEHYIRHENFQVIGFAYKIDDGEPVWVTGDDGEIATAIASLDIENSYLLCHNTAFDGAILAWRYGKIPKYYVDTLSMARPLTGQSVGGSLKALAQKFGLGEKGDEVVNAMGKRRYEFTHSEMARYGEYCKNDVQLTWNLYHVLRQYNPPKEMYIQDLMIRMFTDPVLELDLGGLTEHLRNVRDKKAALMERIDSTIGRDALMSNPKFAEVLRKLGVEPPMKTSLRTQKETYAFGKTDQAFKNLLEHPDPRVQAIVAARMGVKSTLEETRTESFMGVAVRGPLPIMLNYWGAHTGRASGGDKMNLQNLPRGGALRMAIKAPPGHKIVAVDSAQIEARVVAWLAGQGDLVEDFRNNVDIYSKFASEVYGYPVSKATKTERHVGKTAILGLGYGMGWEKFRATLKIGMGGISVDFDEARAKGTVDIYRNKYNRIVELWGAARDALPLMAKGYEAQVGVGVSLRCTPEGVHLPNGTMIRYPNLRYDVAEKQYIHDGRYGPVKIYGGKMIENIVQALARIVVFDQMAKVDQMLRQLDRGDERYKTVLTVHDEVVAVVPEHYAVQCLADMVRIMSAPPSWAPGLPVSCEGAMGDSYGDAK
jgi:DNA polymerase